MSTYLELVNDAIRESGVDLDQLTSSNFATTTDTYHLKFKKWVQQAWREIQLERRWNFTTSQNRAEINSGGYRILYDAADVAMLATGRFVKGVTSAAVAKVVSYAQLPTTTDNTGFGTQGDALLLLKEASATFNLGEEVSVYDAAASLATIAAGTAVISGTVVLTGPPSFNILESRTNPNALDYDEVYISDRQVLSGTTGFDLGNRSKLEYLPYHEYRLLLPTDIDGVEYGKPRYFTVSPDGLFEFYPFLPYTSDYYTGDVTNPGFLIEYTSRRDTGALSAYTDVPYRLPADYHDIISWRAVMYYANDDEKPSKWRTARGRYDFYKRRLEENLIEQPRWYPNPYTHG